MPIERITDQDVAAAWAVVEVWTERINDPAQPMIESLPLLRNLITEAVATARSGRRVY
jgi:hypothetical protein